MRSIHAEDVVRGTVGFVGAFALLDAIAMLSGARASQAQWWLDGGAVSPAVGMLLPGVLGVLFVAAAFAPPVQGARRRMTALVCAFAALVAVLNTVDFYRAWSDGLIRPEIPVPFSLLLVAVLLALAWWHARVLDPDLETRASVVRIVAVAVAWALVFPLAHVAFFGTTDYRRPADAVVVLGAKVWPDGRLTTSLADRVNTAVELYDQGLCETLIMSGAVGVEGVDEAAAMRDRAVDMGVPREAIITDSEGVNTDATVANSLAISEREGFERLMVVSQFYHLPRVELAYRAEGREVYTVPAGKSTLIAKTPLFVAREIPGFWVYWGRVWVRDVLG